MLGIAGAQAIRRLRLRWTWTLFAIAGLLLVDGGKGSFTVIVGVAGIFTAKVARRRERDERLLGVIAGGVNHGMRGPAAYASRLLGSAMRRWRLRSGRWFVGNELLVGYDDTLAAVHVPIQSGGGGVHTLVVGAAGSGKTVTQTWLAMRAIEARLPAIVIDPKDDPDLAVHVRAAAVRAGRRFLEWSPDGPTVYNPYADGGDSEIADKALAGESFSEPHYQRQAQRFIAWEVRILRKAGMDVSLASLASHLDPDRLESVLRGMPEVDAAPGYAYLDSLTTRQRGDLSGVRDRLAILAESDVGPWLDPSTVGAHSFGLLESLRSGSVVFFRLRSDVRPLVMKMLGGAIVLDMLTAAGALQRRRIPAIAIIDEFAALAAPHVGGLFGRARAAGLSLVLSTQEVSDLQLPGHENLLKQVTGNLTTTISHRQVNPESAEWVSRLAGTHTSVSTTLASDGRRTYRPQQQRRLSPEQVTSLRAGQAVVIVHDGPSRSVRVARMLSAAAVR